MRVLVTGSAGHLGEALMRTLQHASYEAVGLDVKSSPFTHHVSSITERAIIHDCMQEVEAVLHTATLHKPHVATHARQDFVDTNVSGTLNLLEEAVLAGVTAQASPPGPLSIPMERGNAIRQARGRSPSPVGLERGGRRPG